RLGGGGQGLPGRGRAPGVGPHHRDRLPDPLQRYARPSERRRPGGRPAYGRGAAGGGLHLGGDRRPARTRSMVSPMSKVQGPRSNPNQRTPDSGLWTGANDEPERVERGSGGGAGGAGTRAGADAGGSVGPADARARLGGARPGVPPRLYRRGRDAGDR